MESEDVVSIDGRGSSLSRRAQDRIEALKTQNERLLERVAVLKNLVQSVSDDRDSYMQRCVEVEDERDRARSIAVRLEQELAAGGESRG